LRIQTEAEQGAVQTLAILLFIYLLFL